MAELILISGCLVGINCKYNGGNNLDPALKEHVNKQHLLPICPEQLGGASTPRLPCEIRGGDGHDVLNKTAKVVNSQEKDVTAILHKGAWEVLKISRMYNVTDAVLKERSPSCGVCYIYDGTFSNKIITGMGVTAALLSREGIKLWTEENLPF